MNELEVRCLRFAKQVRDHYKGIKLDRIDAVYLSQVIRSSSSIGANYIEANEKLGMHDLIMRLRIARKEAKETQYWLELLTNTADEEKVNVLKKEAEELRKILSAIINKIQKKHTP